MAASLPYCDELLAADSIQGLSEVVDAIVAVGLSMARAAVSSTA